MSWCTLLLRVLLLYMRSWSEEHSTGRPQSLKINAMYVVAVQGVRSEEQSAGQSQSFKNAQCMLWHMLSWSEEHCTGQP
eukprot:1142186-Pelagomonas_calceolata.AAC.1